MSGSGLGVPGRRRISAIASMGLLCVCAGAFSAPSAHAQLRAVEVRSVRFLGNETFPSDSLERAIATRETECRSRIFQILPPFCPLGIGFALSRSYLRERDLPRDRARLILYYRQRGFRDVQVDTPTVIRTLSLADVVFRIDEGRPVVAGSIAFEGMEDLDEPGVLEDLPTRPGDPLSTLSLDATRDTIIRRLSNRGYAYADVFRSALRPADDPYNAAVTFEVVPGPRVTYGNLRVSGQQNLSVGTVLRTVQINSGEMYRHAEIEESTSRLYGLEIVRSASVVPDTSEARNPVVDMDITVQEGDAYRVRAAGGWSTAECLNFEARWTSRNFTGGGRVLQIRGRVGNLLAQQFRDVLCTQSGQDEFARLNGLASVEFVQPWIFSTRNSLSTSLFAERQSLPDIFVRRAVGARIALSRTVSSQTVLTAFFRPELSQLDADDVLFCTGLLVCAPEDVASLEGSNWLSPVGLNLARDRSSDLLNPRDGHRLFIDFEHAAPWTTSNFRYDRLVVEASRYDPLGNAVFAARIRGGWVGSGGFDDIVSTTPNTEIVHPQKRFYTGGANSVRGFAQSRLGPRVLVARPSRLLDQSGNGAGGCSPEQIVTLSCVPGPETLLVPQPTGGTRVLEANAELRFPLVGPLEGVAFTDVGQAWAADQIFRLDEVEFTPGFGVRFPSPVGPIRLDLAYRFRGSEELLIVTERIRPFESGVDDQRDRIAVPGPNDDQVTLIDWVSTGQLAVLSTPFSFGANDHGFQLHISIGQAF